MPTPYQPSFNPLHCGAVVASTRSQTRKRRKEVSIPFIAGQWSLRARKSARRRKWRRFNPLHCGAVVASSPTSPRPAPIADVSIPFIAGQWSLPFRCAPPCGGAADEFQSPSLRGSGRFATECSSSASAGASFNPLHCGAVVASWSMSCSGSSRRCVFQSPSLRGSGRFPRPPYGGPGRRRVSIPFIAGQWSLRIRAQERARKEVAGFNPLHCGAVVASIRLRDRFAQLLPGFNPLHCGAVVASSHGRRMAGLAGGVSIPFIAGQWSLRTNSRRSLGSGLGFQSPSLRGSGRFSHGRRMAGLAGGKFQSPSLRGSGRFRSVSERGRAGARVSIPFIAGQWSLPAALLRRRRCSAFQSPSLRGSGRFVRLSLAWGSRVSTFQSPSLRGSGRFRHKVFPPLPPLSSVSIPFIAGQWSLRGGGAGARGSERRFNPLHCGAVVASRRRSNCARRPKRVSIPFIAGQWSLRVHRCGRMMK